MPARLTPQFTRRWLACAAKEVQDIVRKPHSRVPRETGGSERETTHGDSNHPAREQLPTTLNLVNRASVSDMEPGDIVFLDDFVHLWESFPPNSMAILACPLCGTPGLITAAQFAGAATIICGSTRCPGQFRIEDETQIVRLPPC